MFECTSRLTLFIELQTYIISLNPLPHSVQAKRIKMRLSITNTTPAYLHAVPEKKTKKPERHYRFGLTRKIRKRDVAASLDP